MNLDLFVFIIIQLETMRQKNIDNKIKVHTQ
jgi:hypothetical protein